MDKQTNAVERYKRSACDITVNDYVWHTKYLRATETWTDAEAIVPWNRPWKLRTVSKYEVFNTETPKRQNMSPVDTL